MISICIPTQNAGPAFTETLSLWRCQEVAEEIELLVADSGSTDDTVERCRAAGARVTRIRPEAFNHGETRNHLAAEARGDVLVFTVQDARPAARNVLHELVRPLQEDATLGGVSGSQVPHPEADFMGRWETTRLTKNIGLDFRRKQLASWEEFLSWDLPRRFESVAFDNVCSAIRRSAWEAMPFSRIDFGEDLDWAVRWLRRGGALLFNPAARVLHSHCRPPRAWLCRYFVGRRRTNHILQMPPEYSELDDDAAVPAVLQFDARVANFIEGRWSQAVVPTLSRLIDLLLPEKIRRPLRSHGLRGMRYLVNWPSGTRPLLALGRLWIQVVESSGPIPPAQAALVARQLEALILGDFLGSYYHTCEVERRVGPRLAALGRWLAAPGLNGDPPGQEGENGLEPFFSLLK